MWSTRLQMLGALAAAACSTGVQVEPWQPERDATSAAVDAPTLEHLIPLRVRRLSNAEYDATISALLGVEVKSGQSFAPDQRQSGFTSNDAQRVDAVRAQQLFTTAAQFAREARPRFGQLAPCAPQDALETCAQAFIARAGRQAYRRPLRAEEASGLQALYQDGAQDASYDDGVELVLRALLQSASLLYLTELGDEEPAKDGSTSLNEYELASQLSYLITGGPPDDVLLTAAAERRLTDPEERHGQLLRLYAEQPASREQLVRILREWLELDRSAVTAKDVAFYPMYETYGPLFERESSDFIGAVLGRESRAGTSDLQELIAADWTVADEMLADFYTGKPQEDGTMVLAERRGILNQGAFLSVHAHAYESSPVLRGAAVARRIACLPVPDPSTIGIQVSAPPTDPSLTTRQRFEMHTADASCAQCHRTIDSIGDAFEAFDGMGGLREADNDAPVNSRTDIALGVDFDGHYADSNALALSLANSPRVEECFARYLFRAASARSPQSEGTSEDAFIAEWYAQPAELRGNVLDTLGLFVTSRIFSERRIKP